MALSTGFVAFAPDKLGQHRSTNSPRKPQCVQDNKKSHTRAIFTRIRIQSGTSDLDQGHKKGFFTSWPGLTAKAVAKYLPKSIATSKGHLDQMRKNIRSTQPKEPELPEPEGERIKHPTHQIFASIESVGRVYTDQTGRFPVTSSSGHKYICILYAYDANAILTKPIKS